MGTLDVLKRFDGKKLTDFPEIGYSNLYKRIFDNVYFEFKIEDEGILFSPLYTQLRGEDFPELSDFVSKNEAFLDSLKAYIINSLFVYSAIIEENSYHLSKPQSIMMMRLAHQEESNFVIKFYTHYQDEFLDAYNDKIYIGRDFVNLDQFNRENLGLRNTLSSLREQNSKIQDRAKHKLRYYDEYKKPYLDEIDYLTNDTVTDAMERIQTFSATRVANISKGKLDDVLDNILYIQNLMIELKEFLGEFEEKLRLGQENNFVRYLIKFAKDIRDDIIYLRKLSFQIQLKISNFPL